MISNTTKPPLYRICLTGGPCGGKTSAMNYLKEYLEKNGFKVFMVPELPTITVVGGGMIVMGKLSREQVCRFQGQLLTIQKQMEDYFINIAHINDKPSILLFDRGCVDPQAYMDDETFQTVMDETGFNLVYLRDNRYDAVLHLITAADGAEKFYTSENNVARYETAEQAIETDRRTIRAWTGHQRHIVIDNSGTGFDFKLQRIVKSVEQFIGMPVENSLFRSVLVEKPTEIPSDTLPQTFEMEVVFVNPSGENEFEYVQKRVIHKAAAYHHTMRQKCDKPGFRLEYSTDIQPKEYLTFVDSRHEGFNKLQKLQTTFIVGGNQSFYLEEVFKSDGSSIYLLKYGINDVKEEVKLPSFFKVIKDVSEDVAFSDFALAKKN